MIGNASGAGRGLSPSSYLPHRERPLLAGKSWLGRFLNCTNETWQAIPNSYFNKYGGLPLLLKCSYDSKHFDKKMTLFYSEMLEYFKELRSGYPDVYNSEFILWNNKEITIESKPIF